MDHSSLSKIGDRPPLDVYEEVFAFVLKRVDAHGLLKGKTVGVDSTLLEANAARNCHGQSKRHGDERALAA